MGSAITGDDNLMRKFLPAILIALVAAGSVAPAMAGEYGRGAYNPGKDRLEQKYGGDYRKGDYDHKYGKYDNDHKYGKYDNDRKYGKGDYDHKYGDYRKGGYEPKYGGDYGKRYLVK